MYGYQPDEPTNIYAILGQYDHEEIFKIALRDYPVTGMYITSPLRKGTDRNPGCWFEWRGDRLYFVDFADTIINRDAIQFIKDYYKLASVEDAARFIVNYFDSNNLVPNVSGNLAEVLPEKHKKYATILFQSKLFNEKDRLFWSPFEITRSQLREDSVFSLYQYKVFSPKTGRWHITQPFWESYAICGFEGRVKIYNPKRNSKGKWITNCTENDVGGLTSLPSNGDILIITKSYKDWRVIKNQGYNAIWFQNEGMYPADHILQDLMLRFETIYILFDNDKGGIQAAETIKDKFASLGKEVSSFTSPYSYLKDPAEIISVKGQKTLTQFLWENCHPKFM